MYVKRLIGISAVIVVGVGATYFHSMQSMHHGNPDRVSNASSALSQSNSGSGKDDPGSIQDKRPTEWLATSVLTSSVKSQLHTTNIIYNGFGSFVVNDNQNNLNVNVKSQPYVQLSQLDSKGRPQAANALLAQSSREYRNRQETGNSKTIDPVGWHQKVLYKGKVLYNRGHSIGYALAGSIKGFDASEANPLNITTQTSWANQASNGNDENTGQNYYETLVRKALDKNKSVRVRYRVTPIYTNNNLVPSGTHMEAKSNDGSVQFNVFVPNVQPGMIIDYATGMPKSGSIVI